MYGLNGNEEWLAYETLKDQREVTLCRLCHLPLGKDDGSGGNAHVECFWKSMYDALTLPEGQSTARGGKKRGRVSSRQSPAPSGI